MSNGSYFNEVEISNLKFSVALDEYLLVSSRKPDEADGYSDKWYYNSLELLRDRMDQLVTPTPVGSGVVPAVGTCVHVWTEESRSNNWRSSCTRCGLKAMGSCQ